MLLRNLAANDGDADGGDDDGNVNGEVVLHNRWSCLAAAAGRLHTSFPEANPSPPTYQTPLQGLQYNDNVLHPAQKLPHVYQVYRPTSDSPTLKQAAEARNHPLHKIPDQATVRRRPCQGPRKHRPSQPHMLGTYSPLLFK